MRLIEKNFLDRHIVHRGYLIFAVDKVLGNYIMVSIYLREYLSKRDLLHMRKNLYPELCNAYQLKPLERNLK